MGRSACHDYIVQAKQILDDCVYGLNDAKMQILQVNNIFDKKLPKTPFVVSYMLLCVLFLLLVVVCVVSAVVVLFFCCYMRCCWCFVVV